MSPELHTPMVGACTGGNSRRGPPATAGGTLARYHDERRGERPRSSRARRSRRRRRGGWPRRGSWPSRRWTATARRRPRTGRGACTTTSRAARSRRPLNAAGWPTDSATRWSTRSGTSDGDRPRQRGAPVVADDVGPLDAEVVEHAEHVAGEEGDGVGVDLVGLVRCRRSRAGRGRSTRKPAPARAGTWWRHRRPESGKPWSSTTGRPSPGDLELDADPVHVDAHDAPPRSGRRDGGDELFAGGAEHRLVRASRRPG